MKRDFAIACWPVMIFSFVFCRAGGEASADANLVLVRNGTAAATIILAKEPTRAAQFGAYELQWHIEQMTGACLPIVHEGEPAEGVRILVGEGAATRALGLMSETFRKQEYLISFRPRTLVLIGRDKPDTGRVKYDLADPSSFDTWPGLWDERATTYAVYDFLERYCGVRWFNPTDSGTDIPETKTLFVKGKDIRRAPFFSYRDATGAIGDNDGIYDSYTALWRANTDAFKAYEASAYPELHRRFPDGRYGAAKRMHVRLFQLRMRSGGEIARCNHSLYGYYDRFWQKNPADPEAFVAQHKDWFAQGYESTPPQMCYTNRGLVEQVAQDARDYFDGRKTGKDLRIFWQPALPNPFPIEPMDNSFFCKCDNCQALLRHKGKDVPFYSRGTHSEYFFTFVNEVAKEVRKTHPDAQLVTLAYMTHAIPPRTFNLEPNVAVQFCFASNRAPYSAEYHHEIKLLRQWAQQKGRPLYLWLYYTFPKETADNGGYHCFPGFFAHAIGQQFKVFRECGVRGMFHCGYGQDVEAYITYRLMDDPTLNVNELLDDYFTRLYGAAAKPMKELYLAIEKVYCDPANYPKRERISGAQLAWGRLGTAQRMQHFAELMAHAKHIAQTALERHRVDLFEKSVWSYMVAGRKQFMERMAAPIPSLTAPRVPDTGGDLNRVDWRKAADLPDGWFQRGQDKPSLRRFSGRVAHDGNCLYIELTDPCDTQKLVTSASVFPYDDWEVFIAAQRAQPYRQYAVSPSAQIVALSHGEVNWRQNVEIEHHGVRAISDTSAADKWVVRMAIPLKDSIPGGVKPGEKVYLNIIRVTSPGVGGSYPLSIDSWVSHCTVHEVDRLAEILLEK